MSAQRGVRLRLLPPPRKARKVSTDKFRTETAQDEHRRRWNVAIGRLAP